MNFFYEGQTHYIFINRDYKKTQKKIHSVNGIQKQYLFRS